MPPPSAKDVDWEVLPPESEARKQTEPLFRWIALLMDDLLRIPGTRFRVGLDPLIGLIPGLGDTGSALVSAFALIQAARAGVPKILLARMSVNILLNQIIGIIPVAGDAFSVWFKSNARNLRILQEHTAAARKPRTSDWLFVFGVIALLGLVIIGGLAATIFLLNAMAQSLPGW